MKRIAALTIPILLALSVGCSGACAGASQVIRDNATIRDDATKTVDCIVPAIATLGACLDTKVASPGMCAFNTAIALISCVASHPAIPHATPVPATTVSFTPSPGPTSCYDQCSCIESPGVPLQMVCVAPMATNPFPDGTSGPRTQGIVLPYSHPRNRAARLQYVGESRGVRMTPRLE